MTMVCTEPTKELHVVSVETEIGNETLKIETGKLAKLAAGSALVTYGDTVVLVTVVNDKPREGIDFFPLTCDYREKMYAAGKFPGGFIKRENRPSQKEILTMRLTDRPIRPLFPAGFKNEIQIQCMVLSADLEHDPDILAMCGASAALTVSNVPFEGPTATVRIARIDNKLVVNPTMSQRAEADLELIIAGHADGVNMIEGAAGEIPEDAVAEAIELGFKEIKRVVAMIKELGEKVGPDKSWDRPETDPELPAKVRALCEQHDLREARRSTKKEERKANVKAVSKKILEELIPEDAPKDLPYTKGDVLSIIHEIEEELFIDSVLDDDRRTDGRAVDEIRDIGCEVGVLPRTHGSALFHRGETQALVVVTLGTVRDEQRVDDLLEEYSKKFMLHYNFPPFCTGEAKRIGPTSRREIGHGNLAETALQAVLPDTATFPYTIRVVSDILESNGSSSMASVCGGTLSMMDAGVKIKHPVAGISIGLVQKGERYELLSDILGEEDHFGGMDFKVAGSQVGITAIQLDLKYRSITQEQIVETLARAKEARMHILKKMLACIEKPRAEISSLAPRLLTLKIDPEKIGKVIGPGGKGIKAIQAATGANIDIEDDGTVYISCLDAEKAQEAYETIESITQGVQIGRIYEGRVASVKDFGAFVEVVPGQDGLCHISELSDGYVQKVGDVCNVGDMLRVKVISIDDQGRIKLSRKQVILEEKDSAPADS